MPEYFKMTVEARAEAVADMMLENRTGGQRGGHRWNRIRKQAERQMREAVAQDRAERDKETKE